jgi:hypothetical protein
MAMLTTELISLLSIIIIILKFSLGQKFISWFMKGVKIFLPPNDKDYEIILEIKKDRSKNSQADAIVRTCEVKEYINVIKDENITEIESLVFFYLASFVNLLFVESTKIMQILNKKYILNEDGFEDDSTPNENILNVGTSFVLITLCYLLYTSIKTIFKGGYKSYEARLFYMNTIIFFIAGLIVLFFFDGVFNIDHQNICEVVNDRLEQIMIQADQTSQYKKFDYAKICNKKSLSGFYSLSIAILVASVARSSLRLSTFDDFLINASDKAQDIFKQAEDKKISVHTKRIQLISKLKLILNAFLLLLFIDPLFKNYLIEKKIMTEISFYMFIIFPAILTEFIFNTILTKYYASLFLNQNYYDMIEFCKNPDKGQLNYIRTKMDYLNKKFWEILLNLFNVMFSNLLLVLFFMNRSDVLSFILDGSKKNENFKFKTNFIETLIYFWILSITFGKAVFGNINTYYLKNFKSDRKVTFV